MNIHAVSYNVLANLVAFIKRVQCRMCCFNMNALLCVLFVVQLYHTYWVLAAIPIRRVAMKTVQLQLSENLNYPTPRLGLHRNVQFN